MGQLGEEREGRGFYVGCGRVRGVVPDYEGGDGSVGGVAEEAVAFGGGGVDGGGGGGCGSGGCEG